MSASPVTLRTALRIFLVESDNDGDAGPKDGVDHGTVAAEVDCVITLGTAGTVPGGWPLASRSTAMVLPEVFKKALARLHHRWQLHGAVLSPPAGPM